MDIAAACYDKTLVNNESVAILLAFYLHSISPHSCACRSGYWLQLQQYSKLYQQHETTITIPNGSYLRLHVIMSIAIALQWKWLKAVKKKKKQVFHGMLSQHSQLDGLHTPVLESRILRPWPALEHLTRCSFFLANGKGKCLRLRVNLPTWPGESANRSGCGQWNRRGLS